MKIILSRKGFDSSAGGVASPITPDGRLISLPIPDGAAPLRYRQLRGQRPSIARLASDLSRNRVTVNDGVHLDPDLDPGQQPRCSSWRPGFGQAGSALGHLDACGVGVGDLFLFFGWFRQVEKRDKQWCSVPNTPDLHILYGWLLVDEIWRDPQPVPASLSQHVHTQRSFRGGNAIYRAGQNWRAGDSQQLPGAGLWSNFDQRLILTDGPRRSLWKLPGWFHPENRPSCLTYHQSPKRWSRDGDYCRLEAAARGQEFVLNCDHYPEALAWATGLIALATHDG